jgi:hypothetical protein
LRIWTRGIGAHGIGAHGIGAHGIDKLLNVLIILGNGSVLQSVLPIDHTVICNTLTKKPH